MEGITNKAPAFDESGEKKQPPVKSSNRGGRRPNTGGARRGAGAKPKQDREVQRTLTEMAEQHANEVVDVQIIDRKTNTTKIVRKTRSEAILDMLYAEAINKKNIQASKEYHDRTRGKPKQELEHSGAIKTDTQRIPTEAELRAGLAYEGKL
jgi:hypothetical protein